MCHDCGDYNTAPLGYDDWEQFNDEYSPDKEMDEYYDEEEHEEYYVDNQTCIACGELYSYTDQSPDYCKAGYCGQHCAGGAVR